MADAEGPPRRPRVAVTGSAGVGKSSLGGQLAERLDVPFLAEGMRRRLEAGLDLHRLSREAFRALLIELLDEMVADARRAVDSAGGFVGDRCVVDVAAFWLYYGFGMNAEATEQLCQRVRASADLYDLIVVLPWGAIPLTSDGVRTPNPWLQLHYQTVLEGLLSRWVPEAGIERLGAELTDIGSRLDHISRRLGAGRVA